MANESILANLLFAHIFGKCGGSRFLVLDGFELFQVLHEGDGLFKTLVQVVRGALS